jgi:hypothetical protein
MSTVFGSDFNPLPGQRYVEKKGIARSVVYGIVVWEVFR